MAEALPHHSQGDRLCLCACHALSQQALSPAEGTPVLSSAGNITLAVAAGDTTSQSLHVSCIL